MTTEYCNNSPVMERAVTPRDLWSGVVTNEPTEGDTGPVSSVDLSSNLGLVGVSPRRQPEEHQEPSVCDRNRAGPRQDVTREPGHDSHQNRTSATSDEDNNPLSDDSRQMTDGTPVSGPSEPGPLKGPISIEREPKEDNIDRQGSKNTPSKSMPAGCPTSNAEGRDRWRGKSLDSRGEGKSEESDKIKVKDLSKNILFDMKFLLDPKQTVIRNWQNLASMNGVKNGMINYIETMHIERFQQMLLLPEFQDYTVRQFKKDLKVIERIDCLDDLEQALPESRRPVCSCLTRLDGVASR